MIAGVLARMFPVSVVFAGGGEFQSLELFLQKVPMSGTFPYVISIDHIDNSFSYFLIILINSLKGFAESDVRQTGI